MSLFSAPFVLVGAVVVLAAGAAALLLHLKGKAVTPAAVVAEVSAVAKKA